MAEKPPLPDEIRAVLDRCVGEMKECMVRALCKSESIQIIDFQAHFMYYNDK